MWLRLSGSGGCRLFYTRQLPMLKLFLPHKKPWNFFRGYEYVQFKKSDHYARSSLIQTLLSVLEFHQISRISGSRTIPPVGNFIIQRTSITQPRRNFLFQEIIQYRKKDFKQELERNIKMLEPEGMLPLTQKPYQASMNSFLNLGP